MSYGNSNEDESIRWRKLAPYGNVFREDEIKYKGRCHCGSIRINVCSDPLDSKYCHCQTCQKLHGAPFQWASIFNKEDVNIEKDSLKFLRFYDNANAISSHQLPCKLLCTVCNSPIADEGRNMMMLFPTVFGFNNADQVPQPFKASCHIFYSRRVISVKDGVPKWSGHKDQSDRLNE